MLAWAATHVWLEAPIRRVQPIVCLKHRQRGSKHSISFITSCSCIWQRVLVLHSAFSINYYIHWKLPFFLHGIKELCYFKNSASFSTSWLVCSTNINSFSFNAHNLDPTQNVYIPCRCHHIDQSEGPSSVTVTPVSSNSTIMLGPNRCVLCWLVRISSDSSMDPFLCLVILISINLVLSRWGVLLSVNLLTWISSFDIKLTIIFFSLLFSGSNMYM